MVATFVSERDAFGERRFSKRGGAKTPRALGCVSSSSRAIRFSRDTFRSPSPLAKAIIVFATSNMFRQAQNLIALNAQTQTEV
tara:strand:- start:350 stop:598 length:249 start_codon:yes stop_codon:yes gene_type:complete